jgi:hypothetical protein
MAKLDKITNENHLEEIALTDPDEFVRIEAASLIKDTRLAQSTFTNIAAMDQICWLRLTAAKSLKNKILAQIFLKDIARIIISASNPYARARLRFGGKKRRKTSTPPYRLASPNPRLSIALTAICPWDTEI